MRNISSESIAVPLDGLFEMWFGLATKIASARCSQYPHLPTAESLARRVLLGAKRCEMVP